MMITNALTGFTQPPDKLEFARRAGGQVVTSVICIRSHPFNLGMIATGNHLDLDSLRAAPPARYRSVVRKFGICRGVGEAFRLPQQAGKSPKRVGRSGK